MDVFISSVMAGYEPFRAAAQEAIETLGHRVIRAEDLPASAATPQQACLAGARRADLLVLLVGADYGAVQPSGLSATHEEYREVRDSKPVLVFVHAGVTRDPAEEAFLEDVQAWSTGHFRAPFAANASLAADSGGMPMGPTCACCSCRPIPTPTRCRSTGRRWGG